MEIDVTFRQTDLKINVIKTLVTDDDGRDYRTQLSADEQDAHIAYFQNIAYVIYSELLKKQKSEVDALNRDE